MLMAMVMQWDVQQAQSGDGQVTTNCRPYSLSCFQHLKRLRAGKSK